MRLIGITGDFPMALTLADGTTPIEWRALARDGMTLPASQATMKQARMVLDPGQIYDFEFAPRTAGTLTLQYGIAPFAAPPGYKPSVVEVRVK